MRKFLILAATTAALVTAPAFAATAAGPVDGVVNITGSVSGRCMFTTQSVPLPLGELSQASNGELDPAKVNVAAPDLAGWCNAAASEISVHASKLTGPSEVGAGTAFTGTIDYTATATAGSAIASDSTTTVPAGTPVLLGLYSGTIGVVLSNASAGSKKLIAGDYTSTITVTLTPKFVAAPPA